MIFFVDPMTLQKVQVPPAIVRECVEFTRIQPDWNIPDNDDLRLLDCYWHRMGYYD